MSFPLDDTTRSTPASERRRWPAWYAFVTSWLLPATTTTRMAHLPLWNAYVIHLVAMVLALVLNTVLVEWKYHLYGDRPAIEALAIVVEGFEDHFAAGGFSGLMWALVLDVMLGELLILCLGYLLLPFGAAREPLRDSVRHVLRRLWLHSTAAIPLVLAVYLGGLSLERVVSRLEQRLWSHAGDSCVQRFPDPPPEPSANLTNTYATPSPSQKKAWDQQAECINHHPATIACGMLQCCGVLAMLIVGGWVCWTLLRGLTADRPTRPASYPLLCRGCGYNLTGVAADGCCPECGSRILAFLTEDSDPGSSWDQRANLGRGRALVETFAEGLFRPHRLATRLRIVPVRTGYLSWMLFPIGLISVAPLLVGVVTWDLLVARAPGVGEVLRVGIYLAGIAIFVGLLGICVAASSAGLDAAVKQRRNVFRGTAQLAVYMSGQLVLTAWFLGLLLAATIIFRDEIEQFSVTIGWSPRPADLLLKIAFSVLGATLVIIYGVRVSGASAGLWYARR